MIRLTLSLLWAARKPSVAMDLLDAAWTYRPRRGNLKQYRSHWKWRIETIYGDSNYIPRKEDILSFCKWRRK